MRSIHEVAPSLDDLLPSSVLREPFVNPDGRSAARFERAWIDGVAHIVKYVHPDDDFMMRVSGDLACRTVRAWSAGLLDAAPGHVDHAIVAAAWGYGRNGWGAAIVMRDVSAELLPSDESTIPLTQHVHFLGDLAAFAAATWDWHDEIGLLPFAARWSWFGHDALAGERALGWPEPVPRIADDGWRRFAERAPGSLVSAVEALRRDPWSLASALRATPLCLLHGDVKASNAGAGADGRTVLVDWAYVGEGPVCHELAWHLALDRSRLPVSKEATIESFRAALEGHGIDTSPWWDAQRDLCLLGALVQFGWEKALGDDDELAWWCDAALAGVSRL